MVLGLGADEKSMTLGFRHDPLRWLLRAAVLPAVLATGLLALVAAPRAAEALPVGDLWISEVMYNPSGGDDGNEWVEIFNAGGSAIDLSNYSLGWGGADYLPAIQLVGTIPSGGYFVIGGPNGGPGVGNYDQVENFDPNLSNGGVVAGGIALFNEQAGNVDAMTVPVHAVIYGGIFGNAFGLWDESGGAGDVDVSWPPPGAGNTIEFDGTVWGGQSSPSPGTGNLIPVPETAPSLLMMLGLAGLAAKGAPRNRARARRRSK
jgi:hypothetical protein